MGLFSQKERGMIEEDISDFLENLSWLWESEPLDGDETEEISKMVLDFLDERNGNANAGDMERAGWRRCGHCWMWTQDLDSHLSRRHHAEKGLEAAS